MIKAEQKIKGVILTALKIIGLVFLSYNFSYCQLLWPGDINNNGIANHIDLLYYGIARDAEGPERIEEDTDWYGNQYLTAAPNTDQDVAQATMEVAQLPEEDQDSFPIPSEEIDFNSKVAYPMHEDILIYPNPVENELWIRTQDRNKPIEKVKLYNRLGQLLYTLNNPDRMIQHLDMSTYASGVYVIKVYQNGKMTSYLISK